MESLDHHASLFTASTAAQLARRIVQWRYAERGELGCSAVPYFLTQAEYKVAFAPFQALIEEVVLYDSCEGFSSNESQRFRCEVDTAVAQYIPFVVPWMRQYPPGQSPEGDAPTGCSSLKRKYPFFRASRLSPTILMPQLQQ
eukprot:9604-Heterococcus_DN1.PRE.5